MSGFKPRIHSEYVHTIHLPLVPIKDHDDYDDDIRMVSLCGRDVHIIDDQFSSINCVDCLGIAYYRSELSKN